MLKSGSSRIFRREDLFYVCTQKKVPAWAAVGPVQSGIGAPDCIPAAGWKERKTGCFDAVTARKNFFKKVCKNLLTLPR